MELDEAWESQEKLLVKKDSTDSKNPILSGTLKDSESASSVNTTEENKLDFKGDWLTAGGHKVEVKFYLLGYWFGVLQLVNSCTEYIEIPTFWDKKGISINTIFNLVQKRRPAEFWD